MKEVRYFYAPHCKDNNVLPQEEATHAIRVLRLNKGDEIVLIDGNGSFFNATISNITKKEVEFCIEKETKQEKEWTTHIHLAIAPTKMMDRMEWLAEKITEIGFDEITFLNCKHSERKKINIERIEKIVVSAMKQSIKARKPRVNILTDFNNFIKETQAEAKYIAHCENQMQRNDLFEELNKQKQNKVKNITILIGPEGDFSQEEIKLAENNNFSPITLGSSRLRTETAGLMSIATANIIFRK